MVLADISSAPAPGGSAAAPARYTGSGGAAAPQPAQLQLWTAKKIKLCPAVPSGRKAHRAEKRSAKNSARAARRALQGGPAGCAGSTAPCTRPLLEPVAVELHCPSGVSRSAAGQRRRRLLPRPSKSPPLAAGASAVESGGLDAGLLLRSARGIYAYHDSSSKAWLASPLPVEEMDAGAGWAPHPGGHTLRLALRTPYTQRTSRARRLMRSSAIRAGRLQRFEWIHVSLRAR